MGGATETEVSEKKDRVTDALNATRAAVEEGIVAGGGTALLYASKALANIQTANFDQKVGVDIMRHALTVPCKTIANNAGAEGAVVVGKLLESTDANFGFDAQVGSLPPAHPAHPPTPSPPPPSLPLHSAPPPCPSPPPPSPLPLSPPSPTASTRRWASTWT